MTTTMDGGAAIAVPEPGAAQSFRTRATADGGFVAPPSAVPLAGEENVHTLTAIGFPPPPALFFVDPDRKWSMGDFEKPDRPTTYSVTDENADENGDGGSHDWSTVTTTIPAAAGQDEEEETATNGDGISVGHAETTATVVERHDETTSTSSTERVRCDASATTRPPSSVRVGDDLIVRRRRPTAVLLAGRPLQPPAANYRIPNVNYAVVRRRHTPVVNLHYYV